MNKTLLISILAFSTATVFAQGIEDLTRFSARGLYGSPRFVATGGAFGALGNDFTGIQVNPAGAAVFRRNEMGIAFNFQNINNNADYYGSPAMGNDFNLSAPQFGFVTKLNSSSKTPLALAITMNRTADFNGNRIVRTNNATGSILDFWADAGFGIAPADLPFEPGLAFDAYLINPNGEGYDYDANTNAVRVNHSTETRGRANEFGITLAGTHKNKLHFGATLNIATFRFFESSTYTETFQPGGDVNDLKWNKILDQNGSGINLRAGIIYRLNQMIRLGISGTTPTYYQITDIYSTTISGTTISEGTQTPPTIDSEIFYGARTPGDITASAAFVLGKNGFISADYRLLNFAAAQFGRTSFEGNLDDVNAIADENLGWVQNLRVGGEWRLNQFFLRGGYNLTTSPFKQNPEDGLMQIITGGLGFRANNVEFNVAIAHAITNNAYRPFPAITPLNLAGTQTLTNTSFVFGLGYRF